MHWSIHLIGKPSVIAEALEAAAAKISADPADPARADFEQAKPALLTLVKQNAGEAESPTLALRASSHGTRDAPRLTVAVEPLYGADHL